MITSIIFSKDRPLQLDLCLSSIYKNFPDSTNNVVIYDHSPEFESAYKKLTNRYQKVGWWKQSRSLFTDVLTAISSSPYDYICFFTDDDIVYSPAPKIDNNLFGNPAVTCVSLRMGVNITQRRMLGVWRPDLPLILLRASNGCICWNRSLHPYGSYWSYSLSLDGHVFRKDDIYFMMEELCLLESKYQWKQNPSQLESALQRFWAITDSLVVAPETSVVVNSPNNRVSSGINSPDENVSGEMFAFCEEDFLEEFFNNKQINLELLDLDNISCPHTEIDLTKGIV